MDISEAASDINRCILRIQGDTEQVARILREIVQGILTDPGLNNRARQEIMENLRTIAWEASLASTQRQLGVVKAALAYIPSLLSQDIDVLKHFQGHLWQLRTFFGIAK